MTADGPPTRARRFAAIVRPAAENAGYIGRGANARLARDTDIPESTISRMMRGEKIPEPRSFERLAEVIGVPVRDLLIGAEIVSATSLTETSPSQVRSQSLDPQDAATELGITDPVGRELFVAMVERLRRQGQEQEQASRPPGEANGAAAER